MRQAALMMTAAVLGLAAAPWPAQAQSGLLTPVTRAFATSIEPYEPYWPQWHGRLALGIQTVSPMDGGARLRSGSLLGDYYFYRHPMGHSATSLGGFRATSGLMLGVPSPRLLSAHGSGLAWGHRLGLHPALSQPSGMSLGNEADDLTSSYIGVGYTLLSLRGGWGLSADVGLAAARSNTPWGLGLGNSRMDRPFGEFRLTPLLHLGLSYSF